MASFVLPQQTLTCLKNCGFVLKQIELLYVYHFQYVNNDVKRKLVVAQPKAKASRHNNVSLNNISYSHTSLRSLSFDNKLHYPFLLANTMTILQGVFSCYHGLFCPIKAQDTRAIMDGQYHDKKRDNTLYGITNLSFTYYLLVITKTKKQ